MPPLPTAVVIGGGFFGCMIAVRLREYYPRVVLLEKERDLLQRASYNNQARVHGGYHYPRSLVTALRSRVNFARFTADYADCIDSSFTKYYAVGRELSKVTGQYFDQFCRRIGAPVTPAPDSIRKLFSPELVEDVFTVEEFAFDARRLKQRSRDMLDRARVDVRVSTTATRVTARPDGQLDLESADARGTDCITATEVYNCTYSQTNQLLAASGLPLIPLKHELAEMALVEVPEVFRDKAVTMMCGPFFSCMPFPARSLHTLSHVRYTPHRAWHDAANNYVDAHQLFDEDAKQSSFPYMIRDAQRYLPLLADCRHVDSLWEVKTVLPVSEADDSRPILFKKNWGLPNLHCIMGAKIDNVYDVLDEIDLFHAARRCA